MPRSLALDDEGTRALGTVIHERARELARPLIVALDGRSGAGKSTLAMRLAEALDARVLDGDGFFAGGVTVRTDTPAERARDCIDWKAQRPVLEMLRAGHHACYFAFDWEAFDGRLESVPTVVEPSAIVLFEGVYTARPELADLVDLRVLLKASEATRVARLLAREGSIGAWERQWHEAEEHYFAQQAPEHGFDALAMDQAP